MNRASHATDWGAEGGSPRPGVRGGAQAEIDADDGSQVQLGGGRGADGTARIWYGGGAAAQHSQHGQQQRTQQAQHVQQQQQYGRQYEGEGMRHGAHGGHGGTLDSHEGGRGWEADAVGISGAAGDSPVDRGAWDQVGPGGFADGGAGPWSHGGSQRPWDGGGGDHQWALAHGGMGTVWNPLYGSGREQAGGAGAGEGAFDGSGGGEGAWPGGGAGRRQ